MVAIIKTGRSIHNIFNYNENKVKTGVAKCIGEGNYPADADKMNITMKLNRLLKQASLNDNVKRNSVHISLNFDPSESDLPKEKLMEIADTYMNKIGFGEQPYLVYQHHDAGHPHIHLVSIKIREDGSRIDMQNIGRNQSEKARKEIEQDFKLVKAEGRKKNEQYELQPITMGKIHYGRLESKKAINAVLDGVLPNYKYTSLPELNAVLKLYNVLANRGSEDSRIFRGNGLLYRILDEEGKPIGVPIKASDFYNRPTLKFLESKFTENQSGRIPHKVRVRNTVDMALLGNKVLSLKELITALEKEGINVVLRVNSEGLIYGITYVDHKTKCVFNGSVLGKQYSAKAIQERCNADAIKKELHLPEVKKDNRQKQHEAKTHTDSDNAAFKSMSGIMEITEVLMQPEQAAEYVSGLLKGKKKKKKRKGFSDKS